MCHGQEGFGMVLLGLLGGTTVWCRIVLRKMVWCCATKYGLLAGTVSFVIHSLVLLVWSAMAWHGSVCCGTVWSGIHSMVWYPWYGLVSMLWSGIHGMVWYPCFGLVSMVWSGIHGMVWYPCYGLVSMVWQD